MDKKRMTTREKLDLMKEAEARNEQRRKEFAARQAREARLYEMFEAGLITPEEFERKMK